MCGAERGPLSYNLGVSQKPGKQVPRLLDTARAPGRLSSRCAVMTIADVALAGTAASSGMVRGVVYDVFMQPQPHSLALCWAVTQVFLHGRRSSNRIFHSGHHVERKEVSAE